MITCGIILILLVTLIATDTVEDRAPPAE